MARARAFGVFTLALCLVACVCAHGQVSEEEASKIGKEAKAAAKKTLKNAKDHLRDAELFLDDANALKGDAEQAAAAAAKAAKGNQEAEAIAKKVNTASSSLGPVSATLGKMSAFMADAELLTYQVDANAAFNKFDALLKSADDEIILVEQKRDEIAAIVQEMKKFSDNSPEKSRDYLHRLYTLAQEELMSASHAVDEAKKAKEDILKLKARVNDAVLLLENEKNVAKAKNEFLIAQTSTRNAESRLKDTQRALQSATASVDKALNRKEDALTELKRYEKKPDVPQARGKGNTPNSDNHYRPVKDATQSPTVSGNMISVSVPLLLALIACAALH